MRMIVRWGVILAALAVLTAIGIVAAWRESWVYSPAFVVDLKVTDAAAARAKAQSSQFCVYAAVTGNSAPGTCSIETDIGAPRKAPGCIQTSQRLVFEPIRYSRWDLRKIEGPPRFYIGVHIKNKTRLNNDFECGVFDEAFDAASKGPIVITCGLQR